MKEKKYELTDETIELEGHTLHRIKYLKGNKRVRVNEGQLGGWIESEKNLSQKSDCYILDMAKVYDNSKVIDSAIVRNNAIVNTNSIISENAIVSGDTIVCNSELSGEVELKGGKVSNSKITCNAYIDIQGMLDSVIMYEE